MHALQTTNVTGPLLTDSGSSSGSPKSSPSSSPTGSPIGASLNNTATAFQQVGRRSSFSASPSSDEDPAVAHVTIAVASKEPLNIAPSSKSLTAQGHDLFRQACDCKSANPLEAINLFSRAMNLYKEAGSADSLAVADCLTWMADCHYFSRSYQDCLQCAEKATEIYQNLNKSDVNLPQAMKWAGLALEGLGQTEEAIEYFERAIVAFKANCPSNDPILIDCYCNAGEVYNKTGQFQLALQRFQQAVTALALENDLEIEATAHAGMGTAFANLAQYEKSRDCFLAAKTALQRKADRTEADEAMISEYIQCCERLATHLKAIDAQEPQPSASVSQSSNHLAAEEKRVQELSNKGRDLTISGDYVQAIEAYKQVLAILREIAPDAHHDLAIGLSNIGCAYLGVLDGTNARLCFEEALQKLNQCEHRDNHLLASIKEGLGGVFAQEKRFSEALECFEQAILAATDSGYSSNSEFEQHMKTLKLVRDGMRAKISSRPTTIQTRPKPQLHSAPSIGNSRVVTQPTPPRSAPNQASAGTVAKKNCVVQ